MKSNKQLSKMAMLEQSWSALPETTVINCFRKAGISKENQQKSVQNTDDPFAQLSNISDELKALYPNLTPEGLTTETFIDTDEEVATSIQSQPSNEELLHEFAIENASHEDGEIIDDVRNEMETTKKEQPSKKALFEAMDLIECFTLFPNDYIAMQMRKCTAQLDELIASSSRKKQSTITSFFNPTVTN